MIGDWVRGVSFLALLTPEFIIVSWLGSQLPQKLSQTLKGSEVEDDVTSWDPTRG